MKKCKVAFLLNGGLGSIVLALEYVKKFHDTFSKTNHLALYTYCSPSKAVTDCLMHGQVFVDDYFTYSPFRDEMKKIYDVVIEVIFFPEIKHINNDLDICDNLRSYFDKTLAFQRSSEMCRLFSLRANARPNIYDWGMLNDRDRLHIADPMNLLDIGNEYTYTPVISKSADEVLNRFNLTAKKYITLQRGTNAGFSRESVRDWPVEQYNDLTCLLKQKYPDYTLVQLGESFENCTKIDGTDLCLLGQTDLEEIKVLLKHAFLHIDGECGMVHLRKALKGGPTVVLISALPEKFFGYKGFLNIAKHPCGGYCCGLTDNWFKKCLKYGTNGCMTTLSAQEVMDQIDPYLAHYNDPTPLPVSKRDEILNHPNIKLDPDWVKGWFSHQRIYHYTFETVRLKDIYANVLTKNGWQKTPLKETPPYRYLTGDVAGYDAYMAFKNKHVSDKCVHTHGSFDALIHSMQNGYDTDFMIVLNAENITLDGQHRACVLLHTFGPEHEITVLKVYGAFCN